MGRFTLCQGINASGTEGLKSAFSGGEGNISGIAGRELILPLAEAFSETAREPMFFFLELPEGEGYRTYYLDNCTRPVIKAIIDRFGELLREDGVSRFGFGSHKTDEELYFTDFQEFSIYTKNEGRTKDMLRKLGFEESAGFMTIWDCMSEEEPGEQVTVEIEGETVYDIPGALKAAGMYETES